MAASARRGDPKVRNGAGSRVPLGLSRDARLYSCQRLNQLLADTQVLHALYKKHHWLTRGATFYQLLSTAFSVFWGCGRHPAPIPGDNPAWWLGSRPQPRCHPEQLIGAVGAAPQNRTRNMVQTFSSVSISPRTGSTLATRTVDPAGSPIRLKRPASWQILLPRGGMGHLRGDRRLRPHASRRPRACRCTVQPRQSTASTRFRAGDGRDRQDRSRRRADPRGAGRPPPSRPD